MAGHRPSLLRGVTRNRPSPPRSHALRLIRRNLSTVYGLAQLEAEEHRSQDPQSASPDFGTGFAVVLRPKKPPSGQSTPPPDAAAGHGGQRLAGEGGATAPPLPRGGWSAPRGLRLLPRQVGQVQQPRCHPGVQSQRTPQCLAWASWPRCGVRRTGEVRSGGSSRDKDCPGGVRDEAKGTGAVGGVEFLGHDVGGVQKAGGGVGSGAVARGRGNAVARVVEGGLHDACGTLIETFVSQVERVEVVCGSHPADRGAGPPQATYCTKFRRMRRSAWEREERRS